MPLSDAAVTRLRAAGARPDPATDRYELVEEIGRGGMGVVYRAVDRELDREVAIKVPHSGRSAAFEARLRTESRILARLEHPGIVPIHDVGRLPDGRPFYVMKRVRGTTLSEHVGGLKGLADRLRVFERVCEPVAFAHAHGCIHRDLKPENIMVGAFGEVMIMDWGVARVDGDAAPLESPRRVTATAGTQSGTIVGTVGFMPPEQASGSSAQADHRADVYNLGAILHLLLTGAPPAPGEAAAGIAQRRDIPGPLRSICARALAPRVEHRYASVPALAADVSRFLSGERVEAHDETLLERTTRFARTYRAAILLVLAYIVMRAGVAVLAGW